MFDPHASAGGASSCGLIGIPAAADATPGALCRIRRIEAAHIRGISDGRRSDGCPQVAALIKESAEKNGTWTGRCRVIHLGWIKALTYQFRSDSDHLDWTASPPA